MVAKLTKILSGTRAMCEVFEGGDGRFYLSVVCPALAWYNCGAVLTSEEVAEFHARPESVETLAIRICKDPSIVEERALPQDVYDAIWAPYS
jgi:hypothetical protein